MLTSQFSLIQRSIWLTSMARFTSEANMHVSTVHAGTGRTCTRRLVAVRWQCYSNLRFKMVHQWSGTSELLHFKLCLPKANQFGDENFKETAFRRNDILVVHLLCFEHLPYLNMTPLIVNAMEVLIFHWPPSPRVVSTLDCTVFNMTGKQHLPI